MPPTHVGKLNPVPGIFIFGSSRMLRAICPRKNSNVIHWIEDSVDTRVSLIAVAKGNIYICNRPPFSRNVTERL
jgi:hypothetical protein